MGAEYSQETWDESVYRMHESEIKTSINEARERMAQLRNMRRSDEITSHCDRLSSEVRQTITKARSQLSRNRDALLKEVDDYRARLLVGPSRDAVEAIRNRELSQLSTNAERFMSKCSVIADQSQPRDIDIDSLRAKAAELVKDAQNTRKLLREKTYDNNIMSFKPNQVFTRSKIRLGRRVHFSRRNCIYPSFGGLAASRTFSCVFDSRRFTHCKHLRSLSGYGLVLCWSCEHDELAVAALAVDDINLECISLKKMPYGNISTAGETSNGSILVGHANGALVDFYQVSDASEFAGDTSHHHRASVVSIQSIKDGRVATMSEDNTLKVWELPFGTEALVSISGHGCVRHKCPFGVLSNSDLVTCSNDADNDDQGTLRMWDSHSGRLLAEKSTDVKEACALAVLSTDEIVIASRDGSVRLVSLVDDSRDRVIVGPKENNWSNFVQVLGNDLIVISDSLVEPKLQLLDPRTSKLVQEIELFHPSAVLAFHSDPNKDSFICCSVDHGFTLFSYVGNFDLY